jgi:hypothetical protein
MIITQEIGPTMPHNRVMIASATKPKDFLRREIIANTMPKIGQTMAVIIATALQKKIWACIDPSMHRTS